MVDRKQQDSSRDLLEELEDGWATPSAPLMRTAKPPEVAPASIPPNPTPALAKALEASDDELSKLDDGWLDDLFPGENEEEPDEEPDEPEPELPDERIDPVAFAAAKKARDERAGKKKDRKRAKLESKRARQRAKLDAMRQKQKGKKARSASSSRSPESRRTAAAPAKSARGRAADPIEPNVADEIAIPTAEVKPRASKSKKSSIPPAIPMRSTAASLKLLAVVLLILIVLAAVAAYLLNR